MVIILNQSVDLKKVLIKNMALIIVECNRSLNLWDTSRLNLMKLTTYPERLALHKTTRMDVTSLTMKISKVFKVSKRFSSREKLKPKKELRIEFAYLKSI